jgi:hypothetical protein
VTAPSDDNLPQPGAKDATHTGVKTGLSVIPFVGGTIAEVFNLVIAPPIEKRRDQWLENLYARLKQLEEQFEQLDIHELAKDETFISTLLQATRHAIVNHDEENLRALRNAVLNSAVSQTPDTIKHKMFVEWAHELTAWHIRILRFFDENQHQVPNLNLDYNQWQGNVDSDKLVDVIWEKYGCGYFGF